MRRAVHGKGILKHLNASGRWPSGNVRYYYRPKGQKGVPLPDLPPSHPDFLSAYARAAGLSVAPLPSPRGGSISAGIADYLKSDAFLSLSAGTRTRRRIMLDDIRGRYGTGLVRDLRPHHIRADLEGRPPHPANNRLKCWRGLCRWWQEAGLAEEDAASPVRTRRVLPTEGHLPWSRDDIAKFRARWPHATSQRLAFELLFWTGARMSDAVRLGPGMVDADGWLSYRQSKTGGKVDVPFTAAAPEWAEPSDRVHLFSALREQADRHAVWMVTAQGRPRSIKAASQWFSAAARATGITGGRSAHGLRKTRAQIMAERGATPDQRAAWLGHESLSEVQHYSRGADRRRMLAGTDPEPQSSNSSDRVPTWMRK